MEETGVLIIGVFHGGITHKTFTLRPAKVKDTVDAVEADPRALENDQYCGVCVLSKQISIGGIPREEITPEMLMEMYQQDMSLITQANERLKNKIAGFSEKDPAIKKTDVGSKETGISAPRN